MASFMLSIPPLGVGVVVLVIVIIIVIDVAVRLYFRIRRNPSRPTLTCILDTLCQYLLLLKVGPWADNPDIHHAIKRALNYSNLKDFWIDDCNRDSRFIDRYDVVRTVGLRESQAKYSPAGHFYVLQALMRRMIVRLNFVDYWKKHPSIGDVQMKPPVFVIGFTRTGTTILHELLGLHDEVRSHYSWEQIDPIPTTHDESIVALTRDRLSRYKKNQSHFKFMCYIMGSRIQNIHRIAYDEPEECSIACSVEMPWFLTEMAFNTFAIDELTAIGAGSNFAYYRKYLQLLTWQADDRRDQSFMWMLKCPFYLPYLEALHEEFPDSTVVWTHRDPSECIASSCSLFHTLMLMSMEEDSVDPFLIGKAVMRYTHRCLEAAEQAIQKIGKKFKLVHVRYSDTVNKPEAVCKQVIEQVRVIHSMWIIIIHFPCHHANQCLNNDNLGGFALHRQV